MKQFAVILDSLPDPSWCWHELAAILIAGMAIGAFLMGWAQHHARRRRGVQSGGSQ